MSKKPIQLTTSDKQIYALCDDGSMWRISERLLLDPTYQGAEWERLPSIPQWVNIYLVLRFEDSDKPLPDFLQGWNIDIDAIGDEKRYLKCSKYTRQFAKRDYELLDRFAAPPNDWPDNL